MITRPAPSTLASLVPLVCGHDGCYLYGDDEERVIDVRPIEPPWTIVAIGTFLPLREMIRAWEISPSRPDDVNAFYMGMPAFRYAPAFDLFDVSVQYCRINQGDWERSMTLEKPDELFPHYFKIEPGGQARAE